MTTPERALELADLVNGWPEDPYELDELIAILRHYAEIAPKYQAVLDAEPENEAFQQAAILIADHFDYPWQYMPEQGRADLRGLARKIAAIIKP